MWCTRDVHLKHFGKRLTAATAGSIRTQLGAKTFATEPLEESEISTLFNKYSKGSPRRILIRDALRAISTTGVVPSSVSSREMIEELHARGFDVKLSFLSGVVEHDGGRKISANPPGGLDPAVAVPSLNFDQFRAIVHGLRFIFLAKKNVRHSRNT